MTEKSIEVEIERLKALLTGDMMQDMELKERIFNLQLKLNNIRNPTQRPPDSDYECEGCGA